MRNGHCKATFILVESGEIFKCYSIFRYNFSKQTSLCTIKKSPGLYELLIIGSYFTNGDNSEQVCV